MPSGKVASAYVDLVLRTEAFRKATQDAGGAMREFGNQARAEVGKSREAVRLLNEDIGIGLPRGLQNVISKLPGVATAMNAAFDAVIIFAMIDAVVKVTEKVEAFIKKTEEAAKKNAAAWESAIRPIEDTNDKLELTKTKLDNAIAKLEHKPQNLMKQAIEEATAAADDLGKALDADIAKITTALKDQLAASSWTDALQPRGAGKGGVAAYNIATGLQDRLNQIDAGTAGKDRTERALVGLDPTKYRDIAIQNAIDAATKKLTTAQQQLNLVTSNPGMAFGGQVSGVTDSLQTDVRTLTELIAGTKGMLSTSHLTTAIATDQGTKDRLDANKTAADQEARRAQTAMIEMMRQSSEAYIKHLEETRQTLNASVIPSPSVSETGVTQFLTGSEDEERANRETTENQKRAAEGQQKAAELAFKNAVEQIEADEKLKEEQVKLLEDQGKLSKLAAALALQAIHNQAQGEWQDVYANAQKAGAVIPLSDYTKHAAASGSQSQQDEVAVRLNTVAGATITALDKMAQSFTDVASLVSTTLIHSINSFNDTLIKVLTTQNYQHRNAFTDLGKGIFTDVAKTGLQATEGYGIKAAEKIPVVGDFLKKFDKHKPLGTSGDPIYTKSADAVSQGASSLLSGGSSIGSGATGMLSGITSLFGGSSAVTSAAGADVGAGASSLLSGVSSLAGLVGMADGGVMSPSDFYMTGERGPELISVGSTSRINNARDTSSLMSRGGGVSHTISIDARGASDPAAVNAAVHRAMGSYLPHFGNSTIAASRDDARRTPRK
jgi:hypothetical protein